MPRSNIEPAFAKALKAKTRVTREKVMRLIRACEETGHEVDSITVDGVTLNLSKVDKPEKEKQRSGPKRW